MYDIGSHVTHATYQWWIAKPRSLIDYVLMMGLLIAAIFLLKKIRFKKIRIKWEKKTDNGHSIVIPGSDSPFYRIIRYLEQNATPKQAGESTRVWLLRVSSSYDIKMDVLEPLVEQHYRYRFNAASNGVVDRERFAEAVESCLKMQTQGGALRTDSRAVAGSR